MSLKIEKSGIISASGGTGVNENMLLSTPQRYAPTEYQAYLATLAVNMVLGEIYTIQLWNVDISHTGKSSSQLSVSIYWGGNGMSSQIGFSIPSGHADYLVGTFRSRQHQSYSIGPVFDIYNSPQYADGAKYMYIEKWKLEAGSIPTPFSYSPADPLYTGIDGFIEDNTLANGRFLKDTIHTKNIIEI